METFLRLILSLQFLSPVLKPLTRFLVATVAVPLFRFSVKKLVHFEDLDKELNKDLEQWFRGSLLLLMATANMEDLLFGWVRPDLKDELAWVSVGLRLLLAVGVIEAMPDQELFAIIHVHSIRLLFPKGELLLSLRRQWWLILKGIICRHLDRSSSVFTILSVIFLGTMGWVFYGLAIIQFLIIGLVSSRDKAIDVLREFDTQMRKRRDELAQEHERTAYPESESLPP